MLGAQLNTIHNLRFYQAHMANIRTAIERGELDAFAEKFYESQRSEEREQAGRAQA